MFLIPTPNDAFNIYLLNETLPEPIVCSRLITEFFSLVSCSNSCTTTRSALNLIKLVGAHQCIFWQKKCTVQLNGQTVCEPWHVIYSELKILIPKAFHFTEQHRCWFCRFLGGSKILPPPDGHVRALSDSKESPSIFYLILI